MAASDWLKAEGKREPVILARGALGIKVSMTMTTMYIMAVMRVE